MLSHQGDLEFEASSEVSFIQVWNQDSSVSVSWTQNPGSERQAVCQGQSAEIFIAKVCSVIIQERMLKGNELRVSQIVEIVHCSQQS